MSYTTKKILAILLVIVIVVGWYITIFGMGSIAPIKDKIKLGLDIKGGVYVVMEAQTNATGAELTKLMEQTQAVIEKRVNQLGLSEPVVTIEGDRRIRVELPGADNAQEAIDSIGKTAQLQFVLADGTVVLDGGMIKDAGVTTDHEHGGYAISLEFNKEGTVAFADATRKAYNGQVTSKYDGISNKAILIILDDDIISSPNVNEPIENGQAVITSGRSGGFPQDEAVETAALIRGGALPVALTEVTTSTRSATIGVNALEASIFAGFIGIIIIFLMMLIVYRLMGVAANIALALYVILVLWVLVLLRGVLTLPGIAGIILSIGMAVDANVIIFSRIKEEICNEKSIRVAVQSGFKRAMNTVMDSQLTTIIAAIVLYIAGTSSVKGFALTLIIGIVTSLFTAVVFTQFYLELFADSKAFNKKKYFGVGEDNTPMVKLKKQFNFMKHKKTYYVISITIIVIGLIFTGVRGFNYGIDFTGGTMMQIDMGKYVSSEEMKDVLVSRDIDAEIIYAGDENEEMIIRTTQSLDNDERAALFEDIKTKFSVTDDNLLSTEHFGPSVSKELRNNAIIAVIVASLAILVYIIFRFEWKFGIATTAGIVHDVLMVLAFYAIFNVTINNPFIAGILTVVGYSINDTIVIFDRIRENLGLMKRSNMEELIDKSINQTLVRSIMTSATVVAVMIPLMVLTGPAIREFVLPLMVGVIVGCISSISLCSPLYHDLCKITGGSKYKSIRSKKEKRD